MVLMANRYIVPAALKYQKDIAESVAAVKARLSDQMDDIARFAVTPS